MKNENQKNIEAIMRELEKYLLDNEERLNIVAKKPDWHNSSETSTVFSLIDLLPLVESLNEAYRHTPILLEIFVDESEKGLSLGSKCNPKFKNNNLVREVIRVLTGSEANDVKRIVFRKIEWQIGMNVDDLFAEVDGIINQIYEDESYQKVVSKISEQSASLSSLIRDEFENASPGTLEYEFLMNITQEDEDE